MDRRITIIGSGPGGYQSAIRAAQCGAHVTVIERDALGGVCLNWGCIPTKAMTTSAEMLLHFRKASSYGISVNGEISPDIHRIIARKDKIVGTLVQGIQKLFQHYHIHYIKGEGTVVDPHTVSVKLPGNEKVEVTSDILILATGSSPLGLKGFPFDGKNIISINDALVMNEIPERIVVLGGGVNGCEFAFILASLGSDVTVVEARDRLLPISSIDEDTSKIIHREMKKLKIRILLNKTVENVTTRDGSVSVGICSSPDSQVSEKSGTDLEFIEADTLLCTIGRKANTGNMGLDRIGVALDSHGWIVTSDRMETSVTDVYAIGDVVGPEKMMLAHVASAEGMVAVENALGGDKKMDYTVVPSAYYTYPEASSVGLTEKQAQEQGYSVQKNIFMFRLLGKSQAMGEIAGHVKIVSDTRSKKILGVHIVGPHATDLIAEGVLAIQLGTTVEDIASTIHAHPTLSEALMEASHDALGTCIHCPPRT